MAGSDELNIEYHKELNAPSLKKGNDQLNIFLTREKESNYNKKVIFELEDEEGNRYNR